MKIEKFVNSTAPGCLRPQDVVFTRREREPDSDAARILTLPDRTPLRLGHWFGTSAEMWLNMQKLYELRLA